jgi:hypothetical protein
MYRGMDDFDHNMTLGRYGEAAMGAGAVVGNAALMASSVYGGGAFAGMGRATAANLGRSVMGNIAKRQAGRLALRESWTGAVSSVKTPITNMTSAAGWGRNIKGLVQGTVGPKALPFTGGVTAARGFDSRGFNADAMGRINNSNAGPANTSLIEKVRGGGLAYHGSQPPPATTRPSLMPTRQASPLRT